MATCPKCHCGYLIEIGRKLYCMNCDYSCSPAVAALHKGTKHIHKPTSYVNEIKYPANPSVFKNIKYTPSQNSKAPIDYRTRKNKAKPLSIIPAIIIIFWIIAMLFSFVSEFIETFFF